MSRPTAMFSYALTLPTSVPPTRGSAGAAGYDLSAAEDAVVPARGQAMIETGIVFQIPPDCYGRVAPRSGLAAKHRINVHAGVVDSDYRGTVRVILMNHGDADFAVRTGDRIAQIVFERICTPDLVCLPVAELAATERGDGAFGSTGVAAPLATAQSAPAP